MSWKRFFKIFVWDLSSTFAEQWKKKLFVAREIQYFELGIFPFNSYVYYLTRGFITSTVAFNLPARAFSLPTRWFEPVTRRFELVTRGFELITRGFELVTRWFELVTHGSELVTRNSSFISTYSFTTSGSKLYYYKQKVNVRVVSWVAQRLRLALRLRISWN